MWSFQWGNMSCFHFEAKLWKYLRNALFGIYFKQFQDMHHWDIWDSITVIWQSQMPSYLWHSYQNIQQRFSIYILNCTNFTYTLSLKKKPSTLQCTNISSSHKMYPLHNPHCVLIHGSMCNSYTALLRACKLTSYLTQK